MGVSSGYLIPSGPHLFVKLLSHVSLWFNSCSSVPKCLWASAFPPHPLLSPFHHSCTEGIMFPHPTKLSPCTRDGERPERLVKSNEPCNIADVCTELRVLPNVRGVRFGKKDLTKSIFWIYKKVGGKNKPLPFSFPLINY